MPRRTMPAAKPARSPMTPPPSAMTASPRSSRAARTRVDDLLKCRRSSWSSRRPAVMTVDIADAGRVEAGGQRRKMRGGDILVGDDGRRGCRAAAPRSPCRRARSGRRRSGCRRRGRQARHRRSSSSAVVTPPAAFDRRKPLGERLDHLVGDDFLALVARRNGHVGRSHRPDGARPSAFPSRRAGRRFLSSGRFCFFETRSMSTSMSAFSQTESAVRGDRRPRLFVHEGAAAGRQDLRPVLQHAGDHPLFQRAEFGLAIALEQIGNGHARRASRSRGRCRRRRGRVRWRPCGRSPFCRRPSARRRRSKRLPSAASSRPACRRQAHAPLLVVPALRSLPGVSHMKSRLRQACAERLPARP